jgi:LacI family transcriptional regulator
MNQALTLKDIAREAGVSLMTVSRALRHDPKVSAPLRTEIIGIAERLGYRPNPLVSALMSYRRAGKPAHCDLVVAFITNFPTRDGWRDFRLYQEFYRGADQSANRHGYHLEEFWMAEPGMTPARLSAILRTRNIIGVLLAPLATPVGRLELEWDQFQAVTFGYSIIEPPLHRVSNFQFRSMRLVMMKLAECGYRRPGLALSQSLDDRVLHQWLGGFLVEKKSLRERPIPLYLAPDQKWSQQRFENWLNKHRPDVVIAHSEELIQWVRHSGRRVPEDVGFVHLDCPAVGGELSGLYQNGPEIGAAAADMLIGMLRRNERGLPVLPRALLIEGSWAQGKTIRPLAGGSFAGDAGASACDSCYD